MNASSWKRRTMVSSKRRIISIDSSAPVFRALSQVSAICLLLIGVRCAVNPQAPPQQVGRLEQLGLFLQLVREAREANRAPLHDVDPVGEPEGDRRELLDQQHADA